ncbi:MAG: discoidin domain-containing protein [Acidobacteria bacterium]|nr:discoidin domain-containing protein [Acidobacteriota bacterium]
MRGLAAAALFACALLATGCGESVDPAPPAPDPNARPAGWGPVVADDELLTPTRGAVIADRSGEFSYMGSALNVIDADNATQWVSPPKDPVQWVVIELPAMSRIRRVGASTGEPYAPSSPVKTLRFEGSRDGRTFTALRTIDVEPKKNDQLFDIEPADVRFLRVTTLANHDNPNVTIVPTLHLRGEELEPVAPPSFSGRWEVNGESLELSQDGNTLYGALKIDPPMLFCGVVTGRVARLAWSRGNEKGIAWLAVNPSSAKLSGTWWWLDPNLNFYFGEAWIGDRTGEAPRFTVPIPKVADVHLRKVGRFPLYGLVVRPDGELDVEASASGLTFVREALAAFPTYRVRLELVECDSWVEAKNLERGHARAAKLAASLERAGLPKERLLIQARSRTDLHSVRQRLMYDQVEFSLAGN